MQGTFMSLTGTATLTMANSISVSYTAYGQVYTHRLATNVRVTLDGQSSSLGALQSGDRIQVGGNPVTEITAKRNT